MGNKKWYAALAVVTLLALSGTASAHDMDKCGPEHPHKMCKEGKAKFCHKGMFKKDKAAFEKMHALHEKLHAVLVAPKFDKKAFLALSGQLEQLRGQIEKRHAEAFANMIAKLSQEKREKLAERFHGHEHGEGGWHQHGEQSHGGWWSQGWRSQNNQSHDWTPPSQ